MAKDPLRNSTDATRGGLDQVRDGTATGSAAKGYAEHYCDGSEYNKWGNRVDLSKLAATNFK
jgi:hypothetical protein